MGDAEKALSSELPLATSEVPTVSVFSIARAVSVGAVGMLFCLYVIGFVIMNSFLGRFGLRAGAVFTFDYVAAALCYLIFLTAVAVPVWIICFGVVQWVKGKHRSLSNWIWAIFVVWNALLYIFRQLYFPESYVLESGWAFANAIIIAIMVVHLLMVAILRKMRSFGKLWRVLANEAVFPVYILALSFVAVIGEPNLDGSFLFSAVLLFASATVLIGTGTAVWDLKEHLRRRDIQALLAVLYTCILLVNASQFGRKQYASLPATVGGGRPPTVTLKSVLGTAENAKRFGLPVSDGVIGPVLLLYQTGADVCVITKESFTKRAGGAVQLRRDLVEWIATESGESEKRPVKSTAPPPTIQSAPTSPVASPASQP